MGGKKRSRAQRAATCQSAQQHHRHPQQQQQQQQEGIRILLVRFVSFGLSFAVTPSRFFTAALPGKSNALK